ncbi:MAG: hypothetical protein P8X86_01790 [Desulfofustis sp.]|jgi:hypothetical protein
MLRHAACATTALKLFAALAVAAVLVSVAMVHHARAEFEEPPLLSARDILPSEQLKGPNHEVADEVENNGLFNRYTVSSPFGSFEAPSSSALGFLINELNAIAAMKKVKTDDTAIASLKQSGENTIAGLKNLFTDTEETVKGAASGVQSLFHRASETIGKREVTGAEDSKAQQLIGFSRSKGEIATTFHVNVYTRNKVLQEELDRLAWADYLGGLGVGLATSVVPGVGGIVLSTSGAARLLNEAINTTPAAELWVQSRDKLLALGMEGDTVQLFLNNQMYSPALYTVMTAALESMKGVDNLELLLKVSLQASSPEMARVITEITVLTAGYHTHVTPLKTILPMARITKAVTKDGAVAVILPTDHLIWSERVASALMEISDTPKVAESAGKELWVLGDLSDKARDEFKKAGWKITTGAGQYLLAAKD